MLTVENGDAMRGISFRLDSPPRHFYNAFTATTAKLGPVAQLGERCVRNAEVEGSTPFRSTCLARVVPRRLNSG
jgi:hypothetical protein